MNSDFDHMQDMDADGYDPSAWAPPCKRCNPKEYADWQQELEEEALENAEEA